MEKTLNYSEYLFSQLLSCFNKDFSEMEHDLQFDIIKPAYAGFIKSKFNTEEYGEYECMHNYLNEVYPNEFDSLVGYTEEMRNTITSHLVYYYDYEVNTSIGQAVLELIAKINNPNN